jgi:hypothetical protein
MSFPLRCSDKQVLGYITHEASTLSRVSFPLRQFAISQDLDLPSATVSTAIYHLMWHGKIATDLRSLIFVDSAPTSNTYVWLPEGV